MTERETQVGQELPAPETQVIRSVIVRYASASTDFNEVHLFSRYARAIGPPEVLAHGMRTMGAGLGLITRRIGGPARIGRYYVRFTRPVVVPDIDEDTLVYLTGTAAVVADGVATVNLTTICGGDVVLGTTKAEVHID